MTRSGLLLLPLLAAACAPVPPTRDEALRLCQGEAGLADGISGSIGAGISNDGPVGSGSVIVTNRVFDPQTEEEFIADCVDRELEGRPPPTTYGITAGRRA